MEVPAATPELDAPAPASSLIQTPLDKAATGYTNEMQAAQLRRESAEMGIEQISKRFPDGAVVSENRAPPPPMSYTERKKRVAELKEMRLEFARTRRSIDDIRDKSVALPGSTAAIIPGPKTGILLGAVEKVPGVWSGTYGAVVEPGESVVSDAAAWAELWGGLSHETTPDVDFTKHRIAALFLGQRPTSGYRARLLGAAEDRKSYLLRWREESPGPEETVANNATSPFLLVSVPKDERTVRWVKESRVEGPKAK